MATAPETHALGPRPAAEASGGAGGGGGGAGGGGGLSDMAAGPDGPPPDGPPTRQLDFYQAMHDFKLMFPDMDEDVIEAVLRANNGAVDDTIDQLLTMNVDANGTSQPVSVPGIPGAASPAAGAMGGGTRDEPDQARSESPIYMNQELIKMPAMKNVSSASSSEVGSPPRYDAAAARFDPPSYNDCLGSSPVASAGAIGTPSRSKSSPAKSRPSPAHNAMPPPPPPTAGPPPQSANDVLAELGGSRNLPASSFDTGRSLDLDGAMGFTPAGNEQTAAKTLLESTMAADDDVTPTPTPMPPMMSLLNHDYTGRATSSVSSSPSSAVAARAKRRYRDWNPPLLGTLPDDFLRFTITPPSTPERHARRGTPEHHSHQHHQHHSPVAVQGQHHHHRHHHQQQHRSSSAKHSPQRAMSLGTHSHTMHGTKVKTPQVGRSQSLRNEPGTITVMSSRKNPSLRTVTATHGTEEISSNLIQRKIAENERARTCSTAKMTPEQAQVLEDERLALLAQNEEFLQVLKRDADFMKTLERDRMNATAFESPIVDSNRPPSDQVEGYGSDNQAELGAFPFSQPLHKDENAEFRRQLSHMGGLSKKKFAALAKKFFTRKKKQKKVLKDSVAPSTANLLEEEDTDEELRDMVHTEGASGYDQQS